MFAPAGTPPAAVNWLNAEVKKAFASPEVREKFQKQGAQLMLGSPAEFTAFVGSESKRWGDVIKKANIKIDN